MQFTVVLAAWYGSFMVLGPAVAKSHFGGPAAWGLITSAEAVGLIVGGLASLRMTPRRPVQFVVLSGAAIAIAPLALALLLPLPMVMLTSFGLGITIEMMSVIWNVTMATRIPADMLARVSAYDGLGSMMGMPVGALLAGPIAAAIGVSATQYGAAAIILVASALTLIPRDVRAARPATSTPVVAGTVLGTEAGAWAGAGAGVGAGAEAEAASEPTLVEPVLAAAS